KIKALIRSGYEAKSSPFQQHAVFAAWVESNNDLFQELLEEGERVAGEWMLQAHGTRYELPHGPFVPFDIIRGHERVVYIEFLERVLKVGLPVPRLIHIGHPVSVGYIRQKLEPSGHGAIDPVEGAVWRVERKGRVDFLVKYVRPEKQDGAYLPRVTGDEPVWNEYREPKGNSVRKAEITSVL
ncbi:MAG: hypothetical protein GY757_33505, partial [bacterium]|nr:hypothetical protein [bacterium]